MFKPFFVTWIPHRILAYWKRQTPQQERTHTTQSVKQIIIRKEMILPELLPVVNDGMVVLSWETVKIQFNPTLRTPVHNWQFHLSRQSSYILSKINRLIQTSVNTDNGHFSVSRAINSHSLSTPLYGHCFSAHCLWINILQVNN